MPRDPRELDAELLGGDGGEQMKSKGNTMQASGDEAAGRGSGKGSGSQRSGKESGGYVTQIAAIRVKTEDPKVGRNCLQGCQMPKQLHFS